MSFSTPRIAASVLISCALALEPALARAQPPASDEPPATTEAAEAPTSDSGSAHAAEAEPTRAETSEKSAVPPPRPVAEDRAPAPPNESLRTCRHDGRDVCRPRLIGGGVVLGLGVAAAAAGVALTLVKSKPVADDPAYERTFLPAGLVLTGASLLAITLGAMLISDAVQRKRGARARLAWRTP